jgi:hypothetical protein
VTPGHGKARNAVESPNPTGDREAIRRTLERLRQAREACRTADLPHLHAALEILRTASSEFETWTEHARRGTASASLRAELAQVKRETASFLRLVDACAAVQRGLSARSGATSVSYSPAGSAPVPASVSSNVSAYDVHG